ncbi:SPW repeat domain-containing protein [Streptomyces griseoloalbus]|uniref:SPW repeat domain-containing protein n=1 Tax=Streptomyces griseoloalbus TaxID=67303 RepID=UPI001876D96E
MTTAHDAKSAQSRRVRSQQSLMGAQRQQIIGLLMIVSALLLIVAPWIAGYPDTAKDAHRNELGVGVIVLLIAAARFIWYPGKWPDLVVLLAGAWMIAAPWALSTQKTAVFDGTQVMDVAVGVVLVVLAGISLLMLKLSERHGDRQ